MTLSAAMFAGAGVTPPVGREVLLKGVSLEAGQERALLSVDGAAPTWVARGGQVAGGVLDAVGARSASIRRNGTMVTVYLFVSAAALEPFSPGAAGQPKS
ncbi:hypothetical protein DDF67_12670 [Caulobacter endophyticus]|uniref:Uncharacterized protein n=1 Tax=Caulobacter endophyticus TaxID=2172652 RepID=A0A2T9JYQ4_9CAUL|nr:hypothetical protein DDF67_12670 [Caulobacter endophyticus]